MRTESVQVTFKLRIAGLVYGVLLNEVLLVYEKKDLVH